MHRDQADILICGAGIAGIASAFYLSGNIPGDRIRLIDRGSPMAYTTSRSGENFRDYWPQRCMAALSARSIELMCRLRTRHGADFEIHQSGYDFVSHRPEGQIFPAQHFLESGADFRIRKIDDHAEIRRSFPYLDARTRQVVQIRNAGAVDVHGLGMAMLSGARKRGVELVNGHVASLQQTRSGFRAQLEDGTGIACRRLVLAAGPMNGPLAAQLGIDLGIENYLQQKFVIPDPGGVIPPDMPFTIFADTQSLDWSAEEQELIGDDEDYRWLLDAFPAGLHIKPESAGRIKLGWAFNRIPSTPRWDPPASESFPGIVMRGASRMIPGLRQYAETLPTPVVQFAGYYSRTPENWPVIGPVEEVEGLYLVGALSGFGTMVACAAGELLSAWVCDLELPAYARHFDPRRGKYPDIATEIASASSDGQL